MSPEEVVFRAHYRITFVDSLGETIINEVRSTGQLPQPGSKAALARYYKEIGCELISLQVLHVQPTELEEQEEERQAHRKLTLLLGRASAAAILSGFLLDTAETLTRIGPFV